MNMRINTGMTLEELERERWGEPTWPSHLLTECHRLRKVPLKEFTVENLRIMIGQELSLPYLLPLAFEKLEANPFAQGDFFPGDLLLTVLRVKSEFWQAHPDLFDELSDLMSGVQRQMEFVNKEVLPAWAAHFK